MERPKRILILDKEDETFKTLQNSLPEAFYIKWINHESRLWEMLDSFQPDILVMEVGLTDTDGIEICRSIKEGKSETVQPFIIFITEREEEYTEIAAFQAGADDFLTKPVRARSIQRRFQTIFERSKTSSFKTTDKILINNIIIDKKNHSITITDSNQKLILPRKEFEILFLLSRYPNKFFSREELLKQLWGDNLNINPRVIDVHINKLRDKIGRYSINTMKGVGYKIQSP